VTVGYRCRVCGREVAVEEPLPWRCPASTADDRRHALEFVGLPSGDRVDDPNPFVADGSRLVWSRFAASMGMSMQEREGLVRATDADIEAVDATGFVATPFWRSDELSAELGVNVWVKDETRNVGGSHKARHLMSILLHLQAVELTGAAPWAGGDRPTLAISSCGNAAIAAATLAAAAEWPIEVFVPVWASQSVLRRLRALGARITVCERTAGDPPGDPCVLRFREGVDAGAVPFSVQGTENVLCLDGGRTLGWELADQAAAAGVTLDRAFIQVGGGAFAASVGAALLDVSPVTRLHAVQTEGCAPLARAWQLADIHRATAASHWSELMWPWDEPQSEADGILDDETYDWLAVFEAMAASGGSPIVASEARVRAAHDLVHRSTPVDASTTGTAGLAGLLAIREELRSDEHVAVVLSGITR
jgi:threonine dehydratase